ncbi:uncharacterized protein LOC113279149 [Papaver somniferum]|uniref:uncharacterized protein LOC113279149 n=1 Tax=Papaver somniferum TaxID=3469 RepID=UPI000E702EF2|nr:uncharacterized protein LOC113279149 [Papaver somniferum]
MKEDIRWIIGNGEKISVWFDSWIEEGALIDRFEHHRYVNENKHLKVSDILSNGEWTINSELHQIFYNLQMPVIMGGEDTMVWTRNLKGEFLTAMAVDKMRHKEQPVHWSKKIWSQFLHPSIASNVWKLIQGIYVDDQIMMKNGYEVVSRCCICEAAQDSMEHLLWDCSFSTEIWRWICTIFKFNKSNYFEDIWKGATNCSPLIKHVWISASCNILKELWFQKNKRFFENIKPSMHRFKSRIMKLVNEGGLRITGTKWNQKYDLEIIDKFQLGSRLSIFQLIKTCYWFPPEQEYVIFCCDGASFGNPGSAGFGVVVRDSNCQVLGALSGGIGIASNYLAESYGIMCALELAVQWKMMNINCLRF